MISQEIIGKKMMLARVIEQAKQASNARERITYLLNVSILTSQLNYLLEIERASNDK